MIAIFGSRPIAALPSRGLRREKVEFFACWTEIDIALGLIAELIGAKELGAMVEIGQRNVGTNVLAFDRDEVVFGTVLLVAGDLSRPQLPTEAGSPEQIEHGLIVHDF